jgi:hypothetical protein
MWICVYVRIMWRQGTHFRRRNLNLKPLNMFLTPRRCSVLYFLKSVIYRRTCRYHGCAQLKSLIKYQTTRYNHLPWGTEVCTNVYLSRISGRTCGDRKRWTLCHYMCLSCSTCTLCPEGTAVYEYIYNRCSSRSWHLRRPCRNVLLWNLAVELSDGGQSLRG